jgi:hypothetical protein
MAHATELEFASAKRAACTPGRPARGRAVHRRTKPVDPTTEMDDANRVSLLEGIADFDGIPHGFLDRQRPPSFQRLPQIATLEAGMPA